ncbi:hypothetical protein HYALB_00003958 [Hymenoscyphus albidus]|uniref:Uncharacterized protein n=1 Tax=Hymenoscyphus albidus TaxID=595503 RepID=A0A9N9LXR5_9HELO|nr:hypothetical protein HYALB_00003958 [Hymenoscyphus albidus]
MDHSHKRGAVLVSRHMESGVPRHPAKVRAQGEHSRHLPPSAPHKEAKRASPSFSAKKQERQPDLHMHLHLRCQIHRPPLASMEDLVGYRIAIATATSRERR